MMDIDERVKIIVAEVLDLHSPQIALEARLEDDLCADSLHKIEIVMALEKVFDIEISEVIAQGLISVQDVVDCVTRSHQGAHKVIP